MNFAISLTIHACILDKQSASTLKQVVSREREYSRDLKISRRLKINSKELAITNHTKMGTGLMRLDICVSMQQQELLTKFLQLNTIL